MTDIASLIGAITGIISILMLIYLAGVWKGSVDGAISSIKDKLAKHPLDEITTKINLLWEVYAVDALHDRPNLAHNQSPLVITAEGESEIPEHIRMALDKFPSCATNSVADLQYNAVQCLGLIVVKELAQAKGWTLQQTVALLGLYLGKRGDKKNA